MPNIAPAFKGRNGFLLSVAICIDCTMSSSSSIDLPFRAGLRVCKNHLVCFLFAQVFQCCGKPNLLAHASIKRPFNNVLSISKWPSSMQGRYFLFSAIFISRLISSMDSIYASILSPGCCCCAFTIIAFDTSRLHFTQSFPRAYFLFSM